MLHLTMTGEYAVRTMLHLATKRHDTIVPIKEISKQWSIPITFLRKIIQLLCKAGLVISHRGSRGGVALARPAETISLLEVIHAVEGKMVLNACLLHPEACPRSGWCAVRLLWCEAQRNLETTLQTKSLACLAKQSLEKRRQQNLSSPPFPQIEKTDPVCSEAVSQLN